MSITILPALDNVAIGETFAELFTDLSGTITWSFTSNPGNLFALSGNQVLVNGVLTSGDNYTLGFQASNGISAENETFVIPVISAAASWAPGIRPFSINSPANLPLAANQIYQPLLWPAPTGFNYWAQVKNYIDQPAPTQTNVCTYTAPAAWGRPTTTYHEIMDPLFSGAESLAGASIGDNEAIIMSGTTCISNWEFFGHGTTANLQASASCDILADTGFGTLSPFFGAGIVAIGASNMLGALVKEEFTNYGAFNHMIAFAGLSSLVSYDTAIPPAINTDGQAVDGIFAEGSVLSYPPGTSQPSGLSTFGVAIWNAIGTYGAICVDSGGVTGFYLNDVFDATRPSATPPYSAATSWDNSDIFATAGLINDANLIFPLLSKTGYPIDGYYGTMVPFSLCAPQLQTYRYAGQPLINIIRDSDSARDDIGYGSTPQALLNTTAIATFCLDTTGRLFGYYDQSFHSNYLSAGSAAPIVYQSGAQEAINSQPAVLFDGSSNYLKATGQSTHWPSTAVYFNAVIQLTDLLANYAIFGSDGSGGLSLQINQTTGQPEIVTNTGTVIGSPFVALAAGSAYLISVTYVAGTSWSMSINGVSAGSGSTSVTAAAGNVLIGQAGPTSTNFYKGLIGAFTTMETIYPGPQYGIEQGLIKFWNLTATFTRIHNTVVSDTFTDTNGTDLASHAMNVGTGWTDLSGTHFIQSNTAEPNTLVSNDAYATFTPLSAGSSGVNLSDGVYTVILTPNGTGANTFTPGLIFRLSNTSNYYIIQIDSNNLAVLSSVVAGAGTALATLPITYASGTAYTVAVTFYGSAISFTVNGGSPASVTNTFNQTATICGIRSAKIGSPAGVCTFDNLTYTT